jgi:hypothetical protein
MGVRAARSDLYGAAHIAEHMAFKYRQQIEQAMGLPLPPLNSKLPPEVEQQLSMSMASAAQKVLAGNQADAQQQQQQQQDPIAVEAVD